MKYLEGTADAIETESAENWIAESEEHFDEARRLYMLLLAADVRGFSDTMGIESRLARAKGKIRSRRRKADLWKWLQRSAAILFIPVTISLFALLYHYTSGYEPQMLTVSTNPGMTASFRLPDSTLVCLNSGSTLTYPSHFTDGQRSVSLRGEAYFEVTKDAERRFVLSMPEGTEIEVLGTKFNAEAYDDEVILEQTPVADDAGAFRIRDFRLSGIGLSGDRQQRYAEISARLATLQSDFANHVLDATHSFIKNVTEDGEVKGLPAGVLRLAREEARKRSLEGYVFTLDVPSYLPVMTYADNRDLRREMYEAYQTRASEVGPNAGEFDNAPLMEEILALRHELAQLLGFKNYAELSLATKMAHSPEEVMGFLEDLARKSRAQGEKEIAALREYAQAQGLEDELQPWDVAYYAEKLRRERYAYDAESLRPYFPVSKVLQGLFECATRLYGITFRPRYGVDTWHKDVECFDVYDEFGAKTGTFFVDLYAREGKRGGAWMDECQSRRYRSDGALQLPVTYLVCNFTPPVGNRQSELTHDEVVTLFHEFGHGLNQLLTRIDIADVSGINGVPWDAVELPSQFNENFAWQEEVLNFLSGKVGTGEPLPKEKLEALLKARNFESALAMLRQLEFALFDFRLHLDYDPEKGARVRETLEAVRDEVSVVPRYALSRFPNSFTHIFAGGYAAGYYSYKYAEVLAADAFGRFEEEGVLNPELGASFRDHILAIGGAEDPMEGFIAFRGRRPQVDALLKQSGIGTE